MLNLTLKTLNQLKLWPDERKALEKIILYANKNGIKVYLFWSRLNWYGKDIDLILSWNTTKENLKQLKKIAFLNTDTTIDFVVESDKTKAFIDFVKFMRN